MADKSGPDVATGRLPADQLADNFADLHPPLDRHEALVEADRCYFCHDAPCVTACPTSIDIPLFIRQIATGLPDSAARTIFDANILGGMCARVCPTETLCEEVCVRMSAEEKPVRIGLLQRHATDHYMAGHDTYGQRAAPSGKRVAVVGAGPAGLACAHRLAVKGHEVTILDAREKPGGLNEYGIAAYKTVGDFAQKEVDFILNLGGITLEQGKALGKDVTLDGLRAEYDAVFLGLGLAGVNDLAVPGADLEGVVDAVDWIADLRQAEQLDHVAVGRRVVVIGGGMTAVDAAIQAKKLGADEVTMVYRRGREQMNASRYEQDLAQVSGVRIVHWAAPTAVIGAGDGVMAVEFERMQADGDGRLAGTGERFAAAADMVMKAIGQRFRDDPLAGDDVPAIENGRIRVDGEGRTSLSDVWAGGDCVAGGEDLTVAAVEDGKQAAESIHRALMGLGAIAAE